jgi:hypothetical protein
MKRIKYPKNDDAPESDSALAPDAPASFSDFVTSSENQDETGGIGDDDDDDDDDAGAEPVFDDDSDEDPDGENTLNIDFDADAGGFDFVNAI